jgi:hypothetical protein
MHRIRSRPPPDQSVGSGLAGPDPDRELVIALATAVEFGGVTGLVLQLLRSQAAMSENGQRLRRI